MSNQVGRPTKLTPEIVEKAREYLMGGYKDVGDVITSMVGLAQYLGIRKSTLYLWMDGEDDLSVQFSDFAIASFEKQENLLINGGISGAYNANITRLLLSKHGYSEKQAVEVESDDEVQSITVSIKNAAKKPRD